MLVTGTPGLAFFHLRQLCHGATSKYIKVHLIVVLISCLVNESPLKYLSPLMVTPLLIYSLTFTMDS